MKYAEFAERFERAVSLAVALAQTRLGRKLPAGRVIQFHGAGRSDQPMSVADACGLLWLGEDRFFVIVDIGVVAVSEERAELFVRPSGHEPVPWSQTWAPDEGGPFKQIGPELRLT